MKLPFLLFTLLILSVTCAAQAASEYYQIGKNKVKEKDYQAAIVAYDKAIGLDSTKPEIYRSRALARGLLKQFPEAIADFSKALKLKDEPQTYYDRALIKVEASDYNGSLADFDKAEESNKSNPQFYLLRGMCKVLTNNFSASLSDLNKAIEIDNTLPKAYFFRGLAELNLKQKDAACGDFAKAKALNHPKAEALIQKYCQ